MGGRPPAACRGRPRPAAAPRRRARAGAAWGVLSLSLVQKEATLPDEGARAPRSVHLLSALLTRSEPEARVAASGARLRPPPGGALLRACTPGLNPSELVAPVRGPGVCKGGYRREKGTGRPGRARSAGTRGSGDTDSRRVALEPPWKLRGPAAHEFTGNRLTAGPSVPSDSPARVTRGQKPTHKVGAHRGCRRAHSPRSDTDRPSLCSPGGRLAVCWCPRTLSAAISTAASPARAQNHGFTLRAPTPPCSPVYPLAPAGPFAGPRSSSPNSATVLSGDTVRSSGA